MKKKLGEILVASGVVSQADVDRALSEQAAGDASRLGDQLVAEGLISFKQLAKAVSQQHAVPLIDLPSIPKQVLGLVPIHFQLLHRIVPFRVTNDTISIAMADPGDAHAVNELRTGLGKKVIRFVAPADAIDAIHSGLQGKAPVPHIPGAQAEDRELFGTEEGTSGLAEELFSGLDLSPPPAASATVEIREEEEPEFFESQPVVPKAHVPPPPQIAPSPVPRAPPPLPHDSAFPSGVQSSPSLAVDISVTTPPPTSSESIEISLSGMHAAPQATEQYESFTLDSPPPSPSSDGHQSLPSWLSTAPSSSAVAPAHSSWTGQLDKVAPQRLLLATLRVLVERGILAEADIQNALVKKKD